MAEQYFTVNDPTKMQEIDSFLDERGISFGEQRQAQLLDLETPKVEETKLPELEQKIITPRIPESIAIKEGLQEIDQGMFQVKNDISNEVIPGSPKLTQRFGNRSSVEKYSGGVNLGADFAADPNTPLSAPPGEWEVVTASTGWNGGSGNFVKIRNTKTGETLGFEHLNKIGVKPGQKISGGVVVGLSGGSQVGAGRGNSTGSHISIPYQDAQGRYKDVLSSPYAKYL